jgi:N-acetylmuramoyl-L-alanine amidase
VKIVISSGHGLKVRGAKGPQPWGLDEVDEARRVVKEVAFELETVGVGVTTFHDDVSTTQNENLNRIVNFHNAQSRDLDVSVHFNAYENTTKPMGTECLYVTKDELARDIARQIANASSLINRGAKKRTDLFFLNKTEKPAVLVEVCFVDSQVDVDYYHISFSAICVAIASALSGIDIESSTPLPPSGVLFSATGKASIFGGPSDTGVAEDEGLAFITAIEQAPHLFLPYQPSGTTGLARRLNDCVHYVACRWDYDGTPKTT